MQSAFGESRSDTHNRAIYRTENAISTELDGETETLSIDTGIDRDLDRIGTTLWNARAGQLLFAAHLYPTRIHVGAAAKAPENDLQAHAWLTLADEIVVGQLSGRGKYRELSNPDSPHSC